MFWSYEFVGNFIENFTMFGQVHSTAVNVRLG